MSLASADNELLRLQRAALFLQEVRTGQAAIAKRFSGRISITAEQKLAITHAMENSALIAAVKASAGIDLPVNNMAERFEEMCRRQGVTLDAELRPSVVKLLAAELWVNHVTLGVRAEKLVSGTLHQGAIAPDLLKEFPEYQPSLITCAMENAPASSRAFLHRAREEIAALSADPEFHLIAANRPSEIAQAVANSPADARGRLRKMQEAMKGRWTKQEGERWNVENSDKDPHR